MFCRKCGTNNLDDSAFCESCGEALSQSSAPGTTGSPAPGPRFGTIPPSTVIGDYEVVRDLGEGGMGMVFLARHRRLEHSVALKVLAPILSRSKSLVGRFEQEARVQANLQHPNIVRVHDFIRQDEICAMVMEYVPGQTLEQLIHNHTGPMTEQRIEAVMLPVLDALGHAHELGIVHRDIKPSNIMLSEEGGKEVPKVMDFGIAKLLTDGGGMETATGSKLGTLSYMSPEQCTSSRGVDARSDIYSLGATLFEMATGKVPFDGQSEFEVMKAHMEQAPPSPQSIYPGVTDKLQQAILTALKKDPASRYQSAEQFKEALQTGAASAPVAVEQPRADPEQAENAGPAAGRPAAEAVPQQSKTPEPTAGAPAQSPGGVPEPTGRVSAPTVVEQGLADTVTPVAATAVQPSPFKPVVLGAAGICVVLVVVLVIVLVSRNGGGPTEDPPPSRAPVEGSSSATSEPKPAPPATPSPAPSPAFSAVLDSATEYLKVDNLPRAMEQLRVAQGLGDSARLRVLLLRYHLVGTKMWSGVRAYHGRLPGSAQAVGRAKTELDLLYTKYRGQLSGRDLYYAATGYMFYSMLRADDQACSRGAQLAGMALKKGFAETKYIARAYNTRGVLLALQRKTTEARQAFVQAIKQRVANPDPSRNDARICASAWNMAQVPMLAATSDAQLEQAVPIRIVTSQP